MASVFKPMFMLHSMECSMKKRKMEIQIYLGSMPNCIKKRGTLLSTVESMLESVALENIFHSLLKTSNWNY